MMVYLSIFLRLHRFASLGSVRGTHGKGHRRRHVLSWQASVGSHGIPQEDIWYFLSSDIGHHENMIIRCVCIYIYIYIYWNLMLWPACLIGNFKGNYQFIGSHGWQWRELLIGKSTGNRKELVDFPCSRHLLLKKNYWEALGSYIVST